MQRVTLDHKSFIVGSKPVFTELYSVNHGEGLGSYYFLLSIDSKKDVHFDEIAFALNESFKEVFLDGGNDFFEVFENGVTKLNEHFVQLKSEYELDDVLINSVIFAEQSGDVMLTRSGLAEIYMVRDENLIDLSDSIVSDRKSKELFDNVISGKIEKGDRFVFSSERLLRFVTENDLVKQTFLPVKEYAEMIVKKIDEDESVKVIGVALDCKDMIYQEVKVENKDNFVVSFWKNFKRAFTTVFRSILSGDIRSIDLDLRRKIVMFFVALVAFFMLSTLGLAYRSVIKSEEARFRDELQTAQLIVNNAKSEFDKETVGRMLQNAEAKLNSIRGLEALEDDVNDVYAQIRDIRVKIDNVVWVDNPELEVKAFGVGEIGDSLLSVLGYDSLIYLISNFEFIEMVSGVKKDPIDLEAESNDIRSVAWDQDGRTVYLLTNDRGVKKVQGGLVSNLDVDNDSLSLVDASEFYIDKLYLLDRENQQIWRHQAKRNSLGEARAYLSEGYGRYVQDAVDIAIDGYIYVLTDAGDIFRFLRGELDDRFKVASKPMIPLLNPNSIYTELDLPYVFVLESDQNRVVQYFKNTKASRLEYVQQYVFTDLDNVKDISIDYLSRKIYLMTGDSVYSTVLLD